MGRTPAATVPYCLIWKISWGLLQALKVPEDRARLYIGKHGWRVLIRDSEMPTEPPRDLFVPAQSNPRRCEDQPPSNGDEI